jgi:hypothetical protein
LRDLIDFERLAAAEEEGEAKRCGGFAQLAPPSSFRPALAGAEVG